MVLPALTFRQIKTPSQRAKLIALQLVCLPTDDPLECVKGGFAIGVYDKRRLVAFGMAQASAYYAGSIYLSRAGVHPGYRGMGLQRQLIRLREQWALEGGYEHVVTDTSSRSVASMRSLIAEGYKPYWPQQAEPWALPESVYWKKQL